LSHAYLENLAQDFSGTVNRKSTSGYYFVTIDGHAPRIDQVKDRLDAWFATIDRFITTLKNRAS